MVEDSGISEELKSLLYACDDLSRSEVRRLEQSLKTEPNNLDTRVKLIGYYCARSSSTANANHRLAHILWMIEHQPTNPVLSLPFGFICKSDFELDYEQFRKAWLAQIKLHSESVEILAIASGAFCYSDLEFAQSLIAKARAIGPASDLVITMEERIKRHARKEFERNRNRNNTSKEVSIFLKSKTS